jgi:hypothetical protein
MTLEVQPLNRNQGTIELATIWMNTKTKSVNPADTRTNETAKAAIDITTDAEPMTATIHLTTTIIEAERTKTQRTEISLF